MNYPVPYGPRLTIAAGFNVNFKLILLLLLILVVVQRLQKNCEDWFSDVSSTRPDNDTPPRIIIGTPHEIETVLTRQIDLSRRFTSVY